MQTENVFARSLAAVCAAAFLSILSAPAAQAAFPQDQAGIAAYVKLEGVSQTSFDTALDDFFDSTEPSDSTCMIGVKGYLVDDQPYDPYAYNKTDIHVYLGVDGWLAAYLLKDDPAAKIVNWRPGAELKDTLLKVALEDAIAKLGAAPIGEIKYHDFSAPASSKMTLVKESSPANDQDSEGNPVAEQTRVWCARFADFAQTTGVNTASRLQYNKDDIYSVAYNETSIIGIPFDRTTTTLVFNTDMPAGAGTKYRRASATALRVGPRLLRSGIS